MNRWRPFLAVGAVVVATLWVFPYYPLINNPNENVRVYMTIAIVEDGTFAIDRLHRQFGYVNDKATRDGHLYSAKAPGASYLGVPVYALLTWLTARSTTSDPPLDRAVIVYFLRFGAVIVPTWVFAWFFYRFLSRIVRSPWVRDVAFFGTMIGSSLYAFALMFASHSLAAYCVGGALMILYRGDQQPMPRSLVRDGGRFALAGLLGASAAMFEYPAAIASAAIAILLALRSFGNGSKRTAIRLTGAALGGALPVTLTLLYHALAFGSPWSLPYSHLENPTFRAETSQGFFGATSIVLDSVVRLAFDPVRGMFATSPLLLFAFPGFALLLAKGAPTPSARWIASALGVLALITGSLAGYPLLSGGAVAQDRGWTVIVAAALGVVAWSVLIRPSRVRDRPWAATLAAIVLGSWAMIGAMNNWHAGWTLGPRYLVPLIPVLGIVSAVALDHACERRATVRFVVLSLGAASLVSALIVTSVSAAYYPHMPWQVRSPFFDLTLGLIEDGYAPYNAGSALFGLEGPFGLVGLFAVLCAVTVRASRLTDISHNARPWAVVMAAAVTALTLVAFAQARAKPAATSFVLTFVESHWSPAPARSPP